MVYVTWKMVLMIVMVMPRKLGLFFPILLLLAILVTDTDYLMDILFR